MTDWQAIAARIGEMTGEGFAPARPRSLGGGCINAAVKLSEGSRSYFVKTNRVGSLDMFEAEAEGLREMAATGTIRVPRPLCTGIAGGSAYLVMEYLDMGRAGASGAALAGRRLADMHRHTGDRFGWRRDNTIGSTPQRNSPLDDWVAFWRDQRLGFQLRLAAQNGVGGRLQTLGERLMDSFSTLIDHAPQASLLHGDLWGGNLGYDAQGDPVIYDPAVYYGDREADIAMTELFGGFSGAFYAAYREAWPLDVGYGTRKTLYNLYHVLNHLNLFGGGYLGQAEGMIERLLNEAQ